jgi:hypothetical protein
MPAIYKGGIPYTGDTEAKYVGVSMPDSTLNMQELTENLLGDMATVEKQRAQAVHDTGDFLVLDGQLYKCTTSIAVGDRLAVGTNIAKTNAGSEFGSLKGEIAALKESLVVKKKTYYYNNTDLFVYAQRSGNVVSLVINMARNQALPRATYITIATLDEEFWPNATVPFMVFDNATSTGANAVLVGTVGVSGNVQIWIYNDSASNNGPRGSISYIV